MSGPAEAQLEDLVRRFSRLVRAVAAKVGGPRGRQLADDVEQQVFLSIWKQLDREQTIENPSSYIYRCAVRETVRLLKHVRDDETLEPDMPEAAPAHLNPDAQVSARIRAA